MAPRLAWTLLALAAVVGAVLWLWDPQSTRELPGPRATGPSAAPSAAVESLPVAVPEPERSPVAASAALAPEESVPLEVVELASGRPVAGAEAFSLEWEENSQSAFDLQHGEHGALGDWIEAHGRSTRTDVDGRARVPRVRSTGTVFAKHAGQWGLRDYAALDERVVVELRPERGFEVRVVSSEGVAAAGVDVVFRSLDWFGIQFHATTGADGLARFRHLRPFRPFGEQEACEVTLCGLFENRPALRFAAQEDLPPRVELELPPCGALEVVLVGHDGAPVSSPSEFQFVLRDGKALDWVFGSVQSSSPNGRTRVVWVEVGAEFEATGAAVGAREGARTTARGPATVGEVVSLSLKVAPSPAAVFRAVDERGAVLAGRALEFVVRDEENDWDNPKPWAARRTSTDESGKLRLPFRELAPGEKPHEVFRRTIDVLCAPGEDGFERHFRVELDGRPREADVEFGDALFLPAQVIVAGRVIDDTGAPVPDAHVGVTTHGEELAARERGDEEPREVAWAVSDAEGTFSVRGRLDAARLRVGARSALEGARLDVPLGASDVVLTVPTTGGLAGSVLLPPRVLPWNVSLEWMHADPAAAGDPHRRASAVEAAEPLLARFELQSLRTGTGTVRIRIGNREFARFDGIVVSPRAVNRDPRLERIDLRERVRSLRVRVDTPAGSPAGGGVVHAAPSSEGPAFDGRQPGWPIQDGIATCLVPTVPVDLCVVVPGLRRTSLLGVLRDEAYVRLRPAYEVTVGFRGALLPDGLSACLHAPGEDPRYAGVDARADGGATSSTRITAAGPVRVWLVRRSDDKRLGEWTIEISDTEALQSFVLEVDPKKIEEALR